MNFVTRSSTWLLISAMIEFLAEFVHLGCLSLTTIPDEGPVCSHKSKHLLMRFPQSEAGHQPCKSWCSQHVS